MGKKGHEFADVTLNLSPMRTETDNILGERSGNLCRLELESAEVIESFESPTITTQANNQYVEETMN